MAVRNDPKNDIAVFGIYPSSFDAECGAADLISAGFPSRDISVMLTDEHSKHASGHVKATKAPEGTSAGATAGGLLGGALGILAGVGAIVLPGVGAMVAAGPLVAGLTGLGAGGALGGLVGALVGVGIPEYEAKRYEGRIRDGGTLLSVHCDSPARVKRAKQVLHSSGADHVAASHESRSARVEVAVL
jgi:rhodanese-related sulfurtransferase